MKCYGPWTAGASISAYQCTGADWFNRIVVGAAFNLKKFGPLDHWQESQPSSLTAKPAIAQTAEAAELGVDMDFCGPQLRTRVRELLARPRAVEAPG